MSSPIIAVVVAYFCVILCAFSYNGIIWMVRKIRIPHFLNRTVSEAEISDPAAIITLVHGTWARRAAWTEANSPLRKSVAEAFDSPVRFERFDWSGRNWILARQRAARRLKMHVMALSERFPSVPQYMIAHSHGGNIAMNVIADEIVARKIRGVVCLSVPFLTLRPRMTDQMSRIAIWWLPVVTVLAVGSITIKNLFPTQQFLQLVVFALAIGSGFAISKTVKVLGRWIPNALYLPEINTHRVLIIRTPGDEASAAISAAHFVSWLCGLIWTASATSVADAVSRVESWRGILLNRKLFVIPIGVTVFAVSIILLLAFKEPYPPLLDIAITFGFLIPLSGLAIIVRGTLVAILLGGLVLGTLFIPFTAILSLLALVIGPELTIVAFLFHVTAESTPPGMWQVYQVPIDIENVQDEADFHEAGLMHSMSYVHPLALRSIQEWIKVH